MNAAVVFLFKKEKNKKIGCFLIKTKNWLFLSNISYESIKKKGDVRETTLF
jgi:hypothetical protein